MVNFLGAFDEHVAGINLNILIDLIFEPCWLATSRWLLYFLYQKALFYKKNTFLGDESSVLLAFESYPYLVIAWEGVHKVE